MRRRPAASAIRTARRGGARWLAAAIGLLALSVAFGATPAETAAAKEYQVKAAFLYNFTKFVEWPRDESGKGQRAFVIGVLGRDSFRVELEAAVRGRKVNGRVIEVRVLRSFAEAVGAQIVFLSQAVELAPGQDWPPRGVLIVGETETVLEHGGAIAFTFADDKLRFAINVDAATQAGLKISAQLQKLAVHVRKAP